MGMKAAMRYAPANQLLRFAGKKQKHLIGLISGMSMDGVDLAHVKISGSFPDLKIELMGSDYLPYDSELQSRVKAARDGKVEDVAALDFLIGEVFASAVTRYLNNSNINSREIDAIGSHGQSLYGLMLPEGRCRTLQVGSGSVIAERTGILTVFNFRMRDIAAGGNAAPLVPLLDYTLFRESGKTIAINNLGSISNVTLVTENLEDLLASDLGPANMPIDFFAEKMLGPGGVDRDGEYSSRGQVNARLLEDLMRIDFLSAPIPKAAGYQEFGPKCLERLARKYPTERPENLLRTAVEFAACSTAEAYCRFILPRFPGLKEIKFSGGGIYNKTLMTRLQNLMPDIRIETFSSEFSDAKEAMAFALLAHETLCGRPGNIRGATRALRSTLLGEVAFRY